MRARSFDAARALATEVEVVRVVVRVVVVVVVRVVVVVVVRVAVRVVVRVVAIAQCVMRMMQVCMMQVCDARAGQVRVRALPTGDR